MRKRKRKRKRGRRRSESVKCAKYGYKNKTVWIQSYGKVSVREEAGGGARKDAESGISAPCGCWSLN
jgi:hypothetical protein